MSFHGLALLVPPPPPEPVHVLCTEMEAVQQGVPTAAEEEAWCLAGSEETLWEYAVRTRRGIPDHDRWYSVSDGGEVEAAPGLISAAAELRKEMFRRYTDSTGAK